MDPISLITMALPLVLKFAPKLLGLFAGPTAGTAAGQVLDAAKDTFGTIEHDKIELAIQKDQSKIAEFQAALDNKTKETQAFLADTQSARQMLSDLGKAQSPIAWGAPVMTAFVTVGFFIILIIFMKFTLELPEFQKTVLNILVGYLGACFQQSVNFWLGTTRDSQTKTGMIGSLATVATASNAQAVNAAATGTGNGGGKLFR